MRKTWNKMERQDIGSARAVPYTRHGAEFRPTRPIIPIIVGIDDKFLYIVLHIYLDNHSPYSAATRSLISCSHASQPMPLASRHFCTSVEMAVRLPRVACADAETQRTEQKLRRRHDCCACKKVCVMFWSA